MFCTKPCAPTCKEKTELYRCAAPSAAVCHQFSWKHAFPLCHHSQALRKHRRLAHLLWAPESKGRAQGGLAAQLQPLLPMLPEPQPSWDWTPDQLHLTLRTGNHKWITELSVVKRKTGRTFEDRRKIGPLGSYDLCSFPFFATVSFSALGGTCGLYVL